jgi:hypothetical protein
MRSLVSAVCNGALEKILKFDELVNVARENGLFERILPESGDLDPKARSSFPSLLRTYDRRAGTGLVPVAALPAGRCEGFLTTSLWLPQIVFQCPHRPHIHLKSCRYPFET